MKPWHTADCYAACPENVKLHAAVCTAAYGEDYSLVFARQHGDFTYRQKGGEWTLARWRIWWLMRTIPMPGGIVPSLPDIGAATRTRAWSVVLDGIRKYEKGADPARSAAALYVRKVYAARSAA